MLLSGQSVSKSLKEFKPKDTVKEISHKAAFNASAVIIIFSTSII